MKLKFAAAIVAAVALVFGGSAAAQAAGYVAQGPSVTIVEGDSIAMTFTGFEANTPSTASAPDEVAFASLRAATASTPTDGSGSVTYTVTSDIPGTYTITVTAGQLVATGTLTVIPVDECADAADPCRAAADAGSGGLPGTGYELPLLFLWIGLGALALGGAFVFVLRTVRRARIDG
ncbi:hypothetical protein [Agromyces archimandritae]|uniref:LPXTG cell wall anchor domain-containing protein n=1 Tax=Agromyces archimandritae TaxID=2781962 RepID=A0A975IP99_9MICO|nr:hypothetical protein [Agromyces archimandritae]QTX05422.1 hypothetical protein G127AT_04180 [Agromyces archimandritae]